MQGLSNILKKMVFVLIVLTNQQANGSAGGFFGSTEFTQLSNNFELVAMYAQDAENLVTSIKQYETMLKNIENIADFGRLKSLIQSDMEALADVVQKGEALAYSSGNLETVFNNQNKGYQHYKEALSSDDGVDYETVYGDWSKNNMGSILGGLRAAEFQNSKLGEEHDLMAEVQAKLETATGALQATQAAGAIAAQQVSQLQKLRGLLMAQMQSQAAYQASQIERASMKDAARLKFSTPDEDLTKRPKYNNPAYDGTSLSDLLNSGGRF